MNVLVTGGAGYVGSHTCKILKQSGFTPVVVDNLVYGHKWAVQWGPFYQVSLFERQKLVDVMKREKIVAVVHFAAYAYVGESMREPHKYYENNVAGTISLLSAMQEAGVKGLVFSSSCATYGVPERSPIEETSVQQPINPYGHTKLLVEKILQNLCECGQLSAVALRYFNAAGADRDGQIGEDHTPETHLIPLAIEAAFKKERPLTVFGTDYATADGTCIRDYVHVTDLARAHVLALKSISAAHSFRAYNLGTGRGHSVREVISAVETISGRQVNVKYGERRAGDPAELVASPGRAKQELGWEPIQSSLENILHDAIHWYEKHHLIK